MKLIQTSEHKQSLHLSFELSRAIDMLALDKAALERLIDEELMENSSLFEHYPRPESSLFSWALATKSVKYDFRALMMQQVGEERFNRVERIIAEHLIYNLNDDGLLPNLTELSLELTQKLEVFPEWIESVRRRLMALDPLGAGAKNSEEALLVQLKLIKPQAEGEPNWLFDLCQEKKEHPVLRRLNPRPAQLFLSESSLLLVPELLLTTHKDGYNLELAHRASERLGIKKLFTSAGDQSRAQCFLKALYFRESSLHRVAQGIIEHHRGWLFNKEAMKPLTLREIAATTGLSESSVSRLVHNKYISTERGIFELKHFFSAKLRGENGPDRAALWVKDLIGLLLRHDQGRLSDQAISSMLKDQGIKISRRTVNKYRGQLGVATVFQRRALK